MSVTQLSGQSEKPRFWSHPNIAEDAEEYAYRTMLRARRATVNWAEYENSAGDNLVFYEKGSVHNEPRSLALSDVLRAVEDIRGGHAPVAPEWAEKVTQGLLSEPTADLVIQYATFGEVLYWGHRPDGVDSQDSVFGPVTRIRSQTS